MGKSPTWFTAARQRHIAIALATADLLLLVIWFSGSIYLADEFVHGDACYRALQAPQHFVILIHFALGMFITNMEGAITLETERAREVGERVIALSYATYSPLTWIFTGLVALLGDITLLTWAVLAYTLIEEDAPLCRTPQILHIVFDSVALFISALVVLWFIVFSLWGRTRRRFTVPLEATNKHTS